MSTGSKKKTQKKKKNSAVEVDVKRLFNRKRGCNKPLTTIERDQLFALYVVNPLIKPLQRASGVAEKTLMKVRDQDKWEKRREEIVHKSRRNSANEITRALQENLKIVRLAKLKLLEKLKAGKAKSTSTYTDIDKMMRLEQYLLGNPDARLEVGKFDQMSDEDLEKKLIKMKAFTGDVVENEPS